MKQPKRKARAGKSPAQPPSRGAKAKSRGRKAKARARGKPPKPSKPRRRTRRKTLPPARAPEAPRFPLPIANPGMKIGLFGGSFNPPHQAHRAASLLALKRLGLDRVWWLVTPGNPLKENSRLPSLQARIRAAQRLAASPMIDVTGLEAELGTRFTYDTVKRLRQRLPGVAFVLIVGADNLAQLHRWERWRELMRRVPLAIVDRPNFELSSLASPAAVTFGKFRIAESKARMLPRLTAPAWVFLRGLKSELSSTALRKLRSKRPRTKARKG